MVIPLLHPADQLRRAGTAPQRAGTTHVRLRQGMYVERPAWERLDPREQLAVRAHAVACMAHDDHVYSHHSAAALWGLPIIGRWPTFVEHTTRAGSAGRSPGVQRRRTNSLPDAAPLHGLLVTPPARTVIDLAREVPIESAVATADHALRQHLCTAADLRAECDRLPKGARGKRRADLVVRLADPLSESVGESLSRVRMYQLRVPRPTLQVELGDAHGLIGRVDFWWEAFNLVGEFDGKVKYRVPEGATPEQAAEILWREKRREDRLRIGGRRGVARWGWAEAYSLDRFRHVLGEHGVVPAAVDTWLVR